MEQTAQIDPADEYRAVRSIRERRRNQASTLMPGIVLLGTGAWALAMLIDRPNAPPTAWEVARLLLLGLGLSFLVRALVSARAETGLMFLGALITLIVAIGAVAPLLLPEGMALSALWPVGLAALGLSFLITWLFAAARDNRLLLPGLSGVLAGVVALPFTLGLVPPGVIDLIAAYWPLVFGVAGLVALTGVLRRKAP